MTAIYLIQTIVWMLWFWLILIAILPLYWLLPHLSDAGRVAMINRVVRFWAKSMLFLAGARVIVSGQENLPTEPALFMANHQSNFDIPLMLGYIGSPRGLISKIELKKMPFVPGWMDQMGCLWVDRNDPRQSVQMIRDAADQLKKGRSLTIFPEGTRNRGGEVKSFKGGGFKIAQKADACIVPVTIDGTWRLMEGHKPSFLIGGPATIRVTIHPPVATAGLTPEEMLALPDQIRETVIGTL